MTEIEDFEKRFEEDLKLLVCDAKKDKFENLYFGVAVSGGADSICLVTLLNELYNRRKIKKNVKVITVNHNIRKKEETEGDALFVQNYCAKLGIECIRCDIKEGRVFSLCKEKHLSIEESARLIRYEAFSNFIKEHSIDFLCLAHNQNDQVETVFMRFLTGGDTKSLRGIPSTRDRYIRPLLNFTREEIERYLKERQINFCTDSTNFDENLFRNYIRRKIMPMLDKEREGWKSAVLSLSLKMKDDDAFINKESESAFSRLELLLEEDKVSFNKDAFFFCDRAIARRLWYRILNCLNVGHRVPYSLFERVLLHIGDKSSWTETSSGVLVYFESNSDRLFIRKVGTKDIKEDATESGFCLIIKKPGVYSVASLTFTVESKENGMLFSSQDGRSVFVDALSFPIAFRSRTGADVVKDASGKLRPLSKVLESFKCGEYKDSIPVIESVSKAPFAIKCVWASLYSYSDWIIKG